MGYAVEEYSGGCHETHVSSLRPRGCCQCECPPRICPRPADISIFPLSFSLHAIAEPNTLRIYETIITSKDKDYYTQLFTHKIKRYDKQTSRPNFLVGISFISLVSRLKNQLCIKKARFYRAQGVRLNN